MFGYGFICLVIGLISIPVMSAGRSLCMSYTPEMWYRNSSAWRRPAGLLKAGGVYAPRCLWRSSQLRAAMACRAVARLPLRPSLPLHPAARRMRARPLLLAPLNFAAILPLHVCPNLLCSSPFAGKAFDFSHTIHKLAFGREYPVRRHLLLLCSANACRADMH